MPAATATEWLTAAAIGATTLPPLWLVAHLAGSDYQLPHVSLAPARAAAHRAHDAAEHAALKARVRMAAWLLVIAWHLETREATR
ncbi:hypothetical protein [Streptomyces sp. NPDC008137]|uniref:hypothetical protein n=1 Tax=Streptomyces sp. NPDC008137 TaxID=3364813 RepID=UPI0036EA707C